MTTLNLANHRVIFGDRLGGPLDRTSGRVERNGHIDGNETTGKRGTGNQRRTGRFTMI